MGYFVGVEWAVDFLVHPVQQSAAHNSHPRIWPPCHFSTQHPRAAELFERDLAPFLSQSALRFWRPRLRYFAMNDGLYYHGGMVSTQQAAAH